MSCACGNAHPRHTACEMWEAPYYFHFIDFPKGFDWHSGVIEGFIVPCEDKSDVDLMKRYVKAHGIHGWSVTTTTPRSVVKISVVDNGHITIFYRWAPSGLEAAYAWWDVVG